MARIEKTVFISYRRTDVYTALAVYENLKNQGYDVFFDYRSISSGDFEQIITSNIRAHAHFLLILTPTALDRCSEPGDWLRREIEFAIDEKRNIVPLFFRGFRFGDPTVTNKLTGKLVNVSRYNGLNIHEDYFDEAMQRLRMQYLNIPLNTVLHPVSTDVQRAVLAEQIAADEALEQIEDVKELVKQADEKHTLHKDLPKSLFPQTLKSESVSRVLFTSWRALAFVGGGVLVIGFLIWGAVEFVQNLPQATSGPTGLFQPSLTSVIQPSATSTSETESTKTPSPTESAILSSPTLRIGETMISENDGMTLMYVPDGEFTMGSENGDSDEKPVHTVTLDAFWMDKTEVTNSMYAKCVQDGACLPPVLAKSYTRDIYYGDSEFDNYPVIYVGWDDARKYCAWAGRRLPTEAEWEKAARGEYAFVFPWGDDFDGTKANFCDKNCTLDGADKSSDDGSVDTAPVGSYLNNASPYGTQDLAGNVYEWVADWYAETYYASSPASNPPGPASGESRVMRGGSWRDVAYSIRSAFRHRFKETSDAIGFRCAMDASP